ncbi:unnamed protein product [Boreogadus saida]
MIGQHRWAFKACAHPENVPSWIGYIATLSGLFTVFHAAQISTLRQENPTSQRLPKLIEEVNLLAFDISEAIISDLDAREAKAVGTQKAELLQDQYVKVFSNPDAVNITECLANVQPELEEDVELDDFEFTEEDLISALKELDPYSATPDAPNNIKMVFREHSRLGIRKTPPPLNNKAQISVRTDYENLFKMNASRLWNLLPKSINTVTSLEAFKVALGEYLRRIPDTPPVPGYTAVNRNSLLDWSNEKGGRT